MSWRDEAQIEKNMEQRQVLTSLMAGGYLEPALFDKASNALEAEAEALRQEKDSLMHSLNGNMVKANELQKLLREYVNRIEVLSRSEVSFELKCGLYRRERGCRCAGIL